jgi:hypothetical protein
MYPQPVDDCKFVLNHAVCGHSLLVAVFFLYMASNRKCLFKGVLLFLKEAPHLYLNLPASGSENTGLRKGQSRKRWF